jgi:hypothetical protein
MLYGAPGSVPPSGAGGAWRMVSPAATVEVEADHRITGMIAAPAYGTGTPSTFSFAMCWQEAGTGSPVLILPDGAAAPTLQTSYGAFRGTHAAGGSAVPGVAGTIEVGFCVRDYAVSSGGGTIVVDAQTGFLSITRN